MPTSSRINIEHGFAPDVSSLDQCTSHFLHDFSQFSVCQTTNDPIPSVSFLSQSDSGPKDANSLLVITQFKVAPLLLRLASILPDNLLLLLNHPDSLSPPDCFLLRIVRNGMLEYIAEDTNLPLLRVLEEFVGREVTTSGGTFTWDSRGVRDDY